MAPAAIVTVIVAAPALVPVVSVDNNTKLGLPLVMVTVTLLGGAMVSVAVAKTSKFPPTVTAGIPSTPVPVAVPDRGMDSEPPPALLEILKTAERLPPALGWKVTRIAVLVPGVTVIGVEDAVKMKSVALGPVRATAEITKLAFPLFVIVTVVAALLPFTEIAPKFIAVGLGLAAGPNPAPDNATDCGLVETLSTRFSPADRAPGEVGAKVTLMVALLPGATVIGSVPAAKAKSPGLLPAIVKLVITRLPVPELLTVIGVGVLVVATA